MKTLSASLKALVVASLACAAGFAVAADQTTVAVTASVVDICKFSTPAATIAFGPIDQTTGTGAKTAAVTVPYKCTKGATPVVVTGTNTPLKNAANDTMAFTIGTIVAPPGAGFSTAVNATATASIAQAVWQDAPAGTYVGSIVLDITY